MKSVTRKLPQRATLYQQSQTGAIKQWSCWIEPDGITVSSEWGTKGGKLQTTSDKMLSRGKKNTAAYKAPAEVALEEFARQVEGKLRAGYVTSVSKTEQVKIKTDVDFDNLPRSFAPAKPIKEIDLQTAVEWDVAGLLSKQRKRDGMRHYIVAGTAGHIRVYSRGMEDMTEHFIELLYDLELPEGTILDCEFVVENEEGEDQFRTVSSIIRSHSPKAKVEMAAAIKKGLKFYFVAFDLLFYDCKPVYTLPYSNRYLALQDALAKAHAGDSIRIVPEINRPLSQIVSMMKKQGWEGLVLWRKDQATIVHMNRSPKRVNCYKFKLLTEDDFIVTGFERGTGKHQGAVGAFNLAQIDSKGDLHSLGKVGTGLDDDTRIKAVAWVLPCVIQVNFDSRSDTGLRNPRFVRKRDDKQPHECLLPE